MDFRIVQSIQDLFIKSEVKFENNLPNKIYEESMKELDKFCVVLFDQLVENKGPLETVAVTMDFMTNRQHIRVKVARNCLEMDMLMTSMNTPAMAIHPEGKANA